MHTLPGKKSQIVSNVDLFGNANAWKVVNSTIFNTMRILKKVNPADTYIDNYLWHFHKRQDNFMDSYHLMWWIAAQWTGPKNIMEIGCRTGISICQLMSALIDYTDIKVVLCDIFNDGFLSSDIVTMNMKALNIPVDNVEFKIGDSKATVPQIKANSDLMFDYILVDGDHAKESAKRDLKNACDLLKPGGYLLFDDLTPDGCNLQDVWDEFTSEHDDFEFFENHEGKGIGWGVKK
jgi:predicted O-methyltransferase YrrM